MNKLPPEIRKHYNLTSDGDVRILMDYIEALEVRNRELTKMLSMLADAAEEAQAHFDSTCIVAVPECQAKKRLETFTGLARQSLAADNEEDGT